VNRWRGVMLLAAVLALPLPCLAADATVVVVVRHAEKATDDPRDPSLSEAGQVRAEALAKQLADTPPIVVFSTQYRRTRDTAAPTAQAAGVDVTVRPVDAGNAASYARDLARDLHALPAGSTALVVGHSNTVPGIVAAISGHAQPEMPETEYDRYTVIVLDGNGGGRVFGSRY
jgi:broad specificity phosphatase PhoE